MQRDEDYAYETQRQRRIDEEEANVQAAEELSFRPKGKITDDKSALHSDVSKLASNEAALFATGA
jgi:hypothetical protein